MPSSCGYDSHPDNCRLSFFFVSLIQMTTGGGSGGGDAKEQQTGQRGSSFKRIYATSRASTERNLHLVVSGNEIFFFFAAFHPLLRNRRRHFGHDNK